MIYRLNEFGRAIWYNKNNPNLFAERSYDWVDRIVLIDESDNYNRYIVDDMLFSTFDFTDWVPVTKAQYSKVCHLLREIHEQDIQA